VIVPIPDDPLLAEIDLPPEQTEWRTTFERLRHGHAAREDELINHLTDKTLDCQTYRWLVIQLLDAVRRLTSTIQRLRESNARLVAELRNGRK
jgi:hypothetical protein